MSEIDLRKYKKRFPERVDINDLEDYPVQYISGKINVIKGIRVKQCLFLIDYIFIKKNKYKYETSRN